MSVPPSDPGKKLTGVVLGLGVLTALGYLCWLCQHDPNIRFLSDRSPAKWIVYPNPPDALLHPIAESSAEFRRTFGPAASPTNATLKICATGDFKITLNGVPLVSPLTSANWKQPSTIAVTNLSSVQQNHLTITVITTNCPPALWLSLNAGSLTLKSDETWEVSWAGAVWKSARWVDRPPSFGRGDPLAAEETPLRSLRNVWPILLLFAVIVSVALVGCHRWSIRSKSLTTMHWIRNPQVWLFIGIVMLWAAMFLNNARILNPARGFDATEHTQYIQYLIEHRSLPSPKEGWAMYHPPLYYVVCAAALKIAGFSTVDGGGVVLVRFIGLVIALAQVTFVWLGLRQLFPESQRTQSIGLVLAAFLPAQLYLSHYITNEVLAATLVTASFYLCLRIARSPGLSLGSHVGVGVCFGAALLTKVTAVLALPFVCALVAIVTWRKGGGNRLEAMKHLLVMLAACLLVGGWYYVRIWKEFGTPLVGNWNAGLGFDWWQDQGFHTAAYYLSFGEVLRAPFFSGFASFADGTYSTLWGDALYGGTTVGALRPPWNYELMAAGYVLALLPTVLVTIGAVVVLLRSAKELRAEWLLLFGFIGLSLFAFVLMTLKVPSYAQAKAFYLLSTLLPFCALAATGWEWAARRMKVIGTLLVAGLGVWALNSYGSFWIPAKSTNAYIERGKTVSENGNNAAATENFKTAIRLAPQNVESRCALMQQLLQDGRTSEAITEARSALQVCPRSAAIHQDAARVLAVAGQKDLAIELLRRAVELGPDDPRGHLLLSGILTDTGKLEESERACREGLRVRPLSAEIHTLLGKVLASRANFSSDTANDLATEAHMHLQLAGRLGRDKTEVLDTVAWILATHPNPKVRDGGEALNFATQSGRLVGRGNARHILALAAACAESGHFTEAVVSAQEAKALADASRDSWLSEQCDKMIGLFGARQPYHEPTH